MAPTREIINMMKEMENTHTRNNRRSIEETANKI